MNAHRDILKKQNVVMTKMNVKWEIISVPMNVLEQSPINNQIITRLMSTVLQVGTWTVRTNAPVRVDTF